MILGELQCSLGASLGTYSADASPASKNSLDVPAAASTSASASTAMMLMFIECPEDRRALIAARVGLSQVPSSVLKLVFCREEIPAHYVLISELVEI